jgi:hypothetical protein
VEVAFSGSNSVAEKAQLKVSSIHHFHQFFSFNTLIFQLLVGGAEEQFAKLKPILSVFGTLYYVGAVPKATAVKQSVDLVYVIPHPAPFRHSSPICRIAAENAALALACAHLHKQGFDTSDVFLNVLKSVRGSDLATKVWEGA